MNRAFFILPIVNRMLTVEDKEDEKIMKKINDKISDLNQKGYDVIGITPINYDGSTHGLIFLTKESNK